MNHGHPCDSPRMQRALARLLDPSFRIRGRRLQAIRQQYLRVHLLCAICIEFGAVKLAIEVDAATCTLIVLRLTPLTLAISPVVTRPRSRHSSRIRTDSSGSSPSKRARAQASFRAGPYAVRAYAGSRGPMAASPASRRLWSPAFVASRDSRPPCFAR